MGFYADHVLPRGIDWAMSRPIFTEQRRRVVPALSGRVLEVGFGSGLNLPHYTEAVERVIALDPAILGRRLARKRLERCPFEVEFLELDGGRYPLESGSVDAVLSTWTLCSIQELQRALAEMRRVLVPGGELHFLEHGRSPRPGVARWQRRLTPLQRLWAGGCRLDLDVEDALRRAGFEIASLDRFVMKAGGPLLGTTYLGVARSE